MKIGSHYLPMIHPARKFFELLYVEHLEFRKLHNSYNRDSRKVKKYSEAKAGINRKGVHSADWIRDVISGTFIDRSFIAFLKPLVNDRRYDRKKILPSEIDLEFTRIPIEAYYICNEPTVRSFVDVLILENASDETIAGLVKDFDIIFKMEPDTIRKYRYFFFNIPFDFSWRQAIYEVLQDIANIDPMFKESYKPELRVLSGEANVLDVLNSLGYEDATNAYERKLFKKIINSHAREIDRLIEGGKSDLFETIGEAVSSLRSVSASYIALIEILKSEPVITDRLMDVPLESSEIFELNPAMIEKIFYNRMKGKLTNVEIAAHREREEAKRKLANGEPESKDLAESGIKESPESAKPKEDKDGDNPEPPVKRMVRKI